MSDASRMQPWRCNVTEECTLPPLKLKATSWSLSTPENISAKLQIHEPTTSLRPSNQSRPSQQTGLFLYWDAFSMQPWRHSNAKVDSASSETYSCDKKLLYSKHRCKSRNIACSLFRPTMSFWTPFPKKIKIMYTRRLLMQPWRPIAGKESRSSETDSKRCKTRNAWIYQPVPSFWSEPS